MNTPVKEHPTVKAHQQWPTPQRASELAGAVVADEVSFVKSYRRTARLEFNGPPHAPVPPRQALQIP